MWWHNWIVLAIGFATMGGLTYFAAVKAKELGLLTMSIALVILMNIIILKPYELLPGIIVGGSIFGEMFYVTTLSIVTEVWGRKKAKQFVQFGLLAQVILVIGTYLALKLAVVPGDTMQEHFAAIFTPYWRIVFASWLAFYVMGNFKAWLQEKMKNSKTAFGRHLWLRDNITSKVAQMVDNAIFMFVGLAGELPLIVVFNSWWTCTLIEFGFDYIDTIVVTKAVGKMKQNAAVEGN